MVIPPKVIIHPGAMSLDHPIKNRTALYENLRRSVAELDYAGIELLLENLPPHPWYFGGQWITNAFMDAYEIKDFITALHLNFCYDSSHHKLYCNWAKTDFYEQLGVLLPYIRHLHLSDAAGLDGEGLQIGEGAIDWVHFFRVIGEYHDSMIPEIWRGHQRQGEGFLIAIQRLSQAYFSARESTGTA
jgi:N-acetylneuraminate synthase